MLTEALLFFVSFLLLWFVCSHGRRPKNFPKGPAGIPILGYIPWLLPKVHIELCKLGKKYGNIFSVKMGGEFFVVLNDFETIKKALKLDSFAGRPQHMIALETFKDGIAYAQGPAWVEQRRFGLKTLRDFGFGKKGMDAAIHENVADLVEYYRKTAGTPQIIQEHVSMTNLNLVWQLISGTKVELGDPKPVRVYKVGREGILEPGMSGPIYVLPNLAKMFPSITGLASLYRARDELYSLVMEIYTDHKATFIPGQEHRDFMDAYIQKMLDSDNDPNSSFYREKGISALKDTLMNLYFASSDTLTASLEFMFLYLLKWPEKMVKLREEIDSVLGKRNAAAADRIKMPYTEAVIQETFRLSSILPGSVLQTTMQDVEFEGYFIPKGTTIYPNLFGVHRDPEYWDKANEFVPERFLEQGKDGSLVCRKDERVIPFGIGKRECIAVTMTQTELFIVLVSLIQHFEISPVGELPGIEAKTSLVLSPERYKVIFHPR